ncbi:hypothetical protein RUND412_006324 [Rhizina undulata]
MKSGNRHLRAGRNPALQRKKRKYLDANAMESYWLYSKATENPDLTHRELAICFEETFHKGIDRSTVSRNLKKFKTHRHPMPVFIQNSGSSRSAIFPSPEIHPLDTISKKEVVDDPTIMVIDKTPGRGKSDGDALQAKVKMEDLKF